MSNLGFTFAAGEGKYDEQGLFLARSIARTNPDSHIYAFIPENESPRHEDELEELGTIIRGKQTIPEYGISTKVDALSAAEDVASEDYLLLLDTDTLVLDEINIHNHQGDLFLKPVDIGLQYWGRESQSKTEWNSIADKLNLPRPSWSHMSTFDDNPVPPYWNAGFVLTRTNSIGDLWMEAVKKIYPDLSYEWHADQVTLGLLSQEYEVTELDNRYNYPMHLRLHAPPDVKVLHYHNISNLNKAKSHKDFLREIGIWDRVSKTDYSYLEGIWRYIKRRFLPMNETHKLEQWRDFLREKSNRNS